MGEYVELSKDPNELERFVDWKGRPARKNVHGGVRATIPLYAMEMFDNVAFLANAVNLVTYFHGFMYFDLAESANALTNYMGTAFLLALVGGFVSDAYINRFTTNVVFASIELVGYVLLTIQAHYQSLRPAFCDILDPKRTVPCEHVKGGKEAMLFAGLYLVALGTGGVKAALPSHGADQFDDRDPKERRLMSNFFNWFLFSLSVGATIGVTVVVWVQNNWGWDRGFGISAGFVFLGILSITAGLPTYRNRIPGGSPLTRIVQVFVAAISNRKQDLPPNPGSLYEVYDKERGLQSDLLPHTKQFRFLDKAAIAPENSFSSKERNPWRLCTVTQVEEVKVLMRMLPVFASTIVMNTCLAQLQTFSVQQGVTMDTHMGKHFKIPPASLPVIPLVFMVLLIPVYDGVFVPFARKITGHETGITHLQRVGVGLVLSALSMSIAALVEVKRKHVARDHGMLDAIPVLDPLPMNVFWLGFQYFVFGIADLFTFVGLLEFFYSQAPNGMRSLATAFSWCSLALGYFLSSVLVDIVNAATRNITGSHGWLHGNNLNRNHLNLFYWTLATLSMLNFLNYLYWSSWYKYKPSISPQSRPTDDDASTINLTQYDPKSVVSS